MIYRKVAQTEQTSAEQISSLTFSSHDNVPSFKAHVLMVIRMF